MNQEQEDAPRYRPPYKFCHIAGLSFHTGDDIWDYLYEGQELVLLRQPDNKYDPKAVAVALAEDYDPEEPESFDFQQILGYIPRSENADIAAMMDEGYQLEAGICGLNRRAPYDRRVEIVVYVRGKAGRQPTKRFRAVSISAATLAVQQDSLKEQGFMFFTWDCAFPSEVNCYLPIKGDFVVLIHRREVDSVLYLTKVLAVDGDASAFFEGSLCVDGGIAFVLGNIAGPMTVPNWALDFLANEPIDERQPDRFLSKAGQAKLEQVFGVRILSVGG